MHSLARHMLTDGQQIVGAVPNLSLQSYMSVMTALNTRMKVVEGLSGKILQHRATECERKMHAAEEILIFLRRN